MCELKRQIKQVRLKSLKNLILINLTLKERLQIFLSEELYTVTFDASLTACREGQFLSVNSKDNHLLHTNSLFSKLKHQEQGMMWVLYKLP